MAIQQLVKINLPWSLDKQVECGVIVACLIIIDKIVTKYVFGYILPHTEIVLWFSLRVLFINKNKKEKRIKKKIHEAKILFGLQINEKFTNHLESDIYTENMLLMSVHYTNYQGFKILRKTATFLQPNIIEVVHHYFQ